MPKFSENREYLFHNSVVTLTNAPLSENNSNKRPKNWMHQLIRTSNESKITHYNVSKKIKLNTSIIKEYEQCCAKDHMSMFSDTEKLSILNNFQQLNKNIFNRKLLKNL